MGEDTAPKKTDQAADFTLPPFANAENRELHAHIARVEQELAELDLELEEHGERIAVMSDHMRSVQQEIKYTESRLEAEKKEVETEAHLHTMARKDEARTRKDMDQTLKKRMDLADQVAGLQAQIVRATERLDAFRSAMAWNREELEEWAAVQRQKEEDGEAIERYRREDDARQKELEGLVEKMAREVARRREELDAEATETAAAHAEVARAASDFRRLHSERQALLRQWDDALGSMRRRDEAVGAATAAFAGARSALRGARGALAAQAAALEGEAARGRELEAAVEACERQLAEQRSRLGREQARVEGLQASVEAARAALGRATNDLAAQRVANAAATQQLERKRAKLAGERERHEALKGKLAATTGDLGPLEARVDALERLRNEEEARVAALGKEQAEAEREGFRRGQALSELHTREREMVTAIAGGQAQHRNLVARVVQLDAQLLRQQEHLYGVDYALQDMERRVARAAGRRSEDETAALTETIAALTAELATATQQAAALTSQVRATETELGEARRAHAALAASRTQLDEAAATLRLESDSLARAVKQSAAEREAALVGHDALRLEVARLRGALAAAAEEVVGLEARRVALVGSLEQRRGEVEAHRDGLRLELKLAREAAHRLSLEVSERGQHAERLAAKFECLAAKGRAPGEGADGERHSQAYYVVKAAQQREELRARGDQLDCDIQRAQAEVAGLQATLSQVAGTTSAFAASIRRSDQTGRGEEQDALRARLDEVHATLRALRAREAGLATEVAAAAAALEGRGEEEAGMRGALQELESRQAQAQRALQEQQEKLARARRAVEKSQRSHRARVGRSAPPRLGADGGAGGADGGAGGADGGGGGGGAAAAAAAAPAEAGADSDLAAAAEAAAVAAPGVDPSAGGDEDDETPLEKDLRLADMREALRGLLAEARVLDTQHPDAGIAAAFEQAGLKLPQPAPGTGASAASTASSRAGSAASSRASSRASSVAGHHGSSPAALAASSLRSAVAAVKATAADGGGGVQGGSGIRAVKAVQLGLL